MRDEEPLHSLLWEGAPKGTQYVILHGQTLGQGRMSIFRVDYKVVKKAIPFLFFPSSLIVICMSPQLSV